MLASYKPLSELLAGVTVGFGSYSGASRHLEDSRGLQVGGRQVDKEAHLEVLPLVYLHHLDPVVPSKTGVGCVPGYILDLLAFLAPPWH